MSRSPTKAAPHAVVLGVGAAGLAWLERAGAASAWQHMSWAAGADASAAAVEWVRACEAQHWGGIKEVQVCLAPALVQHWVQVAPEQTRSLAELHAVVSARARLLFGNPAQGTWMVSADWDAQDPFVCTAVPSAWGALWEELTRRWGRVTLHSPLTLTLQPGGSQLPREGWCALAVVDRLYVMYRRAGRTMNLRSVRLPPACTPEQAQTLAVQEWQREMLRTQMTGEALAWLALGAQGHAAPDLPELRPVPRAAHAALPPLPDERHEALETAWCAHHWLGGSGDAA